MSSTEGNAPHSRLDDVLKIQSDRTKPWKLDSLETQGASPGKYHAWFTVSCHDTVFRYQIFCICDNYTVHYVAVLQAVCG